MITSSNGNIFRVTDHLCGEFTGPRWIPHTKASDAELSFSLICSRLNGWVNTRGAGALRHHRPHYDVNLFRPTLQYFKHLQLKRVTATSIGIWDNKGCLHLGQWPMTYLMTLSDWTMSCQPWPPRARYGEQGTNKPLGFTESFIKSQNSMACILSFV